MQRESGVLLHISSLASPYGIGTFGQEAYNFVDFLYDTKQTYWQILPLTTTSYGDSPYQSFSAYAGNTYFIDFDLLQEDGLLKQEDYKDFPLESSYRQVDYAGQFNHRPEVLQKAVEHFKQDPERMAALDQFKEENAWWLQDFSEFMALKEHFNHKAWYEWDDDIKIRQADALAHYRQTLNDRIQYHQITQYLFFDQWYHLKSYANNKAIKIIGDMPIYVAHDSVEMWATPEYFKVDNQGNPLSVAGTPPDNFSEDGQYWGNPIYDWEKMKEDGYQWWIKRIEVSQKVYDAVRIDHFRGFDAFWEIPYGSKTAAEGHWSKGPSYDLFKAVKDQLGQVNIIAEDLGFMTQGVIDLRDWTGYPGMKILQFGFNGFNVDSGDLPIHYPLNSIAYVGTHDNETCQGWFYDTASDEIRQQASHYLRHLDGESISACFNRGIASSRSRVAIYTMQDLLGLDNHARMNTPSTLGGNWTWRMAPGALDDALKEDLLDMTQLYFRENPATAEKKDKAIEDTSPDF